MSAFSDEVATMIEQLEAWKERQYHRLKAEYDAKHGEQLTLLDPVEGVDMVQVRDCLLQLNAIETVLGEIGEMRTALYQDMKERGFPAKTIRAALKIARARQKRDASVDVLEACIRIAASLLPDDDDAPPPPRGVPDMTGGAA